MEDDLNSLRLLNMLKTKDDISALKSRVDYNEYEATNRNMEGEEVICERTNTTQNQSCNQGSPIKISFMEGGVTMENGGMANEGGVGGEVLTNNTIIERTQASRDNFVTATFMNNTTGGITYIKTTDLAPDCYAVDTCDTVLGERKGKLPNL